MIIAVADGSQWEKCSSCVQLQSPQKELVPILPGLCHVTPCQTGVSIVFVSHPLNPGTELVQKLGTADGNKELSDTTALGLLWDVCRDTTYSCNWC